MGDLRQTPAQITLCRPMSHEGHMESTAAPRLSLRLHHPRTPCPAKIQSTSWARGSNPQLCVVQQLSGSKYRKVSYGKSLQVKQ